MAGVKGGVIRVGIKWDNGYPRRIDDIPASENGLRITWKRDWFIAGVVANPYSIAQKSLPLCQYARH